MFILFYKNIIGAGNLRFPCDPSLNLIISYANLDVNVICKGFPRTPSLNYAFSIYLIRIIFNDGLGERKDLKET